jgi:nicotinamidase-related amidase
MSGRDTVQQERTLSISPRYFRLYADPGAESAERSFRYRDLDWRIPLDQAALISLDVWNHHFAADTLARIDEITVDRIAPLVATCRTAGLQVIHAPAGPVAQKHPNWVDLMPAGAEPQPVWPGSPAWPPKDFRGKRKEYEQYARPPESLEQERNQRRETSRDFHPAVQPVGDEAVVLHGEELHRLCAQRGILFLFYVGFNTNACIVMRDYGTLTMHARGYEVILVRDCTTGMETHQTTAELVCTRGQIASLEQFGIYTVTAGQLGGSLAETRAEGAL